MDKQELIGIPDAISIDFSRRVRDALKEREEDRQPPWTITGLARAIGIENQTDIQSQSLREYRCVG